MQRAVDGDNVALGEHLLEVLNATAANLLLLLRRQGLVVVVEQLLAVKGLETAQDTLTNTANGDGTDNLVLKVELVLGSGGNVPVTGLNLLVGGHKVAHQDKDGHDDVLGDGDDIGTGHLGDGDTAVGLVGSVQVDMVRADTSSDGNLQVLGLGETLSGEVARVETVICGISLYCCEIVAENNSSSTYGVVMIISASTSSLSKVEFSPSLSEVVIRVWPWSSSHFRRPSSFWVVPSKPGTCSIDWSVSPHNSPHQGPHGGFESTIARVVVIAAPPQELPICRLPLVLSPLLEEQSPTQSIVGISTG